MLAAKRPPDGRVLATNGRRMATNPRQSSLYLLIIFILLRLSEICRWGRSAANPERCILQLYANLSSRISATDARPSEAERLASRLGASVKQEREVEEVEEIEEFVVSSQRGGGPTRGRLRSARF